MLIGGNPKEEMSLKDDSKSVKYIPFGGTWRVNLDLQRPLPFERCERQRTRV